MTLDLLCDLCSGRTGLYNVFRPCCCLRLIRSTPAHGARAAMWAHLAATLPQDDYRRIRVEAEQQGLARPRKSTETAEIGSPSRDRSGA